MVQGKTLETYVFVSWCCHTLYPLANLLVGVLVVKGLLTCARQPKFLKLVVIMHLSIINQKVSLIKKLLSSVCTPIFAPQHINQKVSLIDRASILTCNRM